jgi:hypothetical protein
MVKNIQQVPKSGLIVNEGVDSCTVFVSLNKEELGFISTPLHPTPYLDFMVLERGGFGERVCVCVCEGEEYFIIPNQLTCHFSSLLFFLSVGFCSSSPRTMEGAEWGGGNGKKDLVG